MSVDIWKSSLRRQQMFRDWVSVISDNFWIRTDRKMWFMREEISFPMRKILRISATVAKPEKFDCLFSKSRIQQEICIKRIRKYLWKRPRWSWNIFMDLFLPLFLPRAQGFYSFQIHHYAWENKFTTSCRNDSSQLLFLDVFAIYRSRQSSR